MTYALKVAAAAFVAVATFALLSFPSLSIRYHAPVQEPSAVKVIMKGGHGSGVHIGDGLILTAAHVAKSQTQLQVKLASGRMLPATVLWVGEKHDVALLKASDDMAASPLQCERAPEGTPVRIFGNPSDIEFVQLRGHIIKAKTSIDARWPDAQLLDITATGGVSGGPVFNDRGEVVGLVVGGYSAAPFRGAWGLVGITVPGPILYEMLGRVA